MSLATTLAKKILGNAKDLVKHIFNEAGREFGDLERELLEAIRGHADKELSAKEEQKPEDVSGLRPWQKAPRAEDATSPYAPADLSFDDKEAEESDESEEGEETSTASEPAPTAIGTEEAPFAAPCGEQPTLPNGQGELELDRPAREPPVEPEGSEEGAASHHGDPLPTGGIQSQELYDSGKDGGAATGADLPEEQTKAPETELIAPPVEEQLAPNEASADEPATASPTPEEAQAEQKDAPLLAEGALEDPTEAPEADKAPEDAQPAPVPPAEEAPKEPQDASEEDKAIAFPTETAPTEVEPEKAPEPDAAVGESDEKPAY